MGLEEPGKGQEEPDMLEPVKSLATIPPANKETSDTTLEEAKESLQTQTNYLIPLYTKSAGSKPL
jgi:hypothetical protein